MAKSELISSMNHLSRKIDTLIDRQNKLLERVKDLEIENQRLKELHLSDLQTIETTRKEIEFLSLSHRLAATPEALVAARTKISSLIRTIDSCIRNLKED